jgi:hypothetical protein
LEGAKFCRDQWRLKPCEERRRIFKALVGRAEVRKPGGHSSGNRKCRGPGPNTASILGKDLGSKAPGVK